MRRARRAPRGEGHIPWEQIEPLYRDGMTFRELGLAVLGRLGLSVERHGMMSARVAKRGETMLDVLRDRGVVVTHRDDPEYQAAVGRGSEVVR